MLGKKFHKFIAIADFTCKIEETLKEKLATTADKLCKIEKETWRKVDSAESYIEKAKTRVDKIINEKVLQRFKSHQFFVNYCYRKHNFLVL